MQITHAKGFALLEVLLAIVALTLAGFGVYKLYSSVNSSYTRDQVIRQVAAIASAYNRLAGANLTSSMTSSTVMPQLFNSSLLPAAYFNSARTSLVNIHGTFSVDSISASQVIFKVPLNSGSADILTGYCNDMLKYVSACTNDTANKLVKVTIRSGV